MDKAKLLKTRQAYPLELKVAMSSLRIIEWYRYHYGKIYISFSGGKDSTVLLHMIRKLFPKVVSVFCDTGLEYPEVRRFAKATDNVVVIKPKMKFNEVIDKYGYPIISKEVSQKISEARTTKSAKLLHKRLHGDDNPYKSGKIPNKWQYLIKRGEYQPFKISHKCCDVLKKEPFIRYEKESGQKGYDGTMTQNSHLRNQRYVRNGCNAFDSKRPMSRPLSFWTEEDIWEYIKKESLEISSIYDMGYKNTGCAFCAFGVHMEKSDLFNKNKFQTMKQTHPKLHRFCIKDLGVGKVLDSIHVNY
jgi:3'-phosphoadenosine 5'-phosphosulfate sulfotransferase (PAPS reductase)/FAD synthetase